MSAQIIPMRQFRVRFWIDMPDGIRRVYEQSTPAQTPTSAILRTTREYAQELFGPNPSGKIISVIEQ